MLVFTIVLITLFFLLLTYSFYYFLNLYDKRNQEFLTELQNVHFQNERKLIAMCIQVQEQIRENIAKELHDNVGQKLSIAKLCFNTFGDISNPIQQNKFLLIRKTMSTAIADLGDISRTMNSGYVSHYGLAKAIELELEQLIKLNSFKINFEVSGSTSFISPKNELIIFRIFQEALNNIIKHADCNLICVNINCTSDRLILIIKDNGKGYDTKLKKTTFGAGMYNMSKRANVINADFDIESELTKGTTITIKIPYDKEK